MDASSPLVVVRERLVLVVFGKGHSGANTKGASRCAISVARVVSLLLLLLGFLGGLVEESNICVSLVGDLLHPLGARDDAMPSRPEDVVLLSELLVVDHLVGL